MNVPEVIAALRVAQENYGEDNMPMLIAVDDSGPSTIERLELAEMADGTVCVVGTAGRQR